MRLLNSIILVTILLLSNLYAQDSTEVVKVDSFKVAQEFYENGKLKEIRVQKIVDDTTVANHGVFVRWNEDGERIMDGSYVDGFLNGIVTEYREDLTRKSETRYKFGEKQKATYFGPRGQGESTDTSELRRLTRVDSLRVPDGKRVRKEGYDSYKGLFINHGPATIWYEDIDVVYERGNFKEGKPNGLMERFYRTGIKEFEGTLKNMRYHGAWVYWDMEGKPVKLEIYNNNKMIKEFDL